MQWQSRTKHDLKLTAMIMMILICSLHEVTLNTTRIFHVRNASHCKREKIYVMDYQYILYPYKYNMLSTSYTLVQKKKRSSTRDYFRRVHVHANTRSESTIKAESCNRCMMDGGVVRTSLGFHQHLEGRRHLYLCLES